MWGADAWRGPRSLTRRFTNGTAREDVSAGLVLGLESIPDGLASGVLAGVNLLFGLYAYLFGTPAGAVTTSSTFMVVQATGAMAVAANAVTRFQRGSAM